MANVWPLVLRANFENQPVATGHGYPLSVAMHRRDVWEYGTKKRRQQQRPDRPVAARFAAGFRRQCAMAAAGKVQRNRVIEDSEALQSTSETESVKV